MKGIYEFLEAVSLPASFAVFVWIAFATPVMAAIIPMGVVAAGYNQQKRRITKLEESIAVLQRQVGIRP
jgi:hypothetical protein